MATQEHFYTDDQIRQRWIEYGMNEQAAKTASDASVEAFQNVVEHYAAQGADYGTAFELALNLCMSEARKVAGN